MTSAIGKSLDAPEEIPGADLGEPDLVQIAGGTVGGTTFESGSTRAEHDKPFVDGGADRRAFWRPDGGP
jgi:hypothetical protein